MGRYMKIILNKKITQERRTRNTNIFCMNDEGCFPFNLICKKVTDIKLKAQTVCDGSCPAVICIYNEYMREVYFLFRTGIRTWCGTLHLQQ